MKLKTNIILIGLTLGMTMLHADVVFKVVTQNECMITLEQRVDGMEVEIYDLKIESNDFRNMTEEMGVEIQELVGKTEEKQKEIELLEAEVDKLTVDLQKARTMSAPKPSSTTTSSKKIQVNIVATFYTSLGEENGNYAGKNARGGKLKQGSLAVPKDIPLGSKFYIEGYGNFVADDRGGAIKRIDSNTIKVDIFIPRKSGESDNTYKQRVNNMGIVRTTGWYITP